jgi:tripartite-type tricarboxylate transporter receptor subunit TctC
MAEPLSCQPGQSIEQNVAALFPQGIGRRRVLFALAAGFVALRPGIAGAQTAWPSRTVRIIVPFPPGGPADGSARVLAEVMAPQLGQSVIVENRPGAGGVIGIQAAAQSKDGHTLLMGSTSMTITPSLQPKLPYDVMRDFDPIGMVSAQPLVVVVPGSSPIRSIEDLIKRAQAKPGEVTSANSGNGTLSHLTAELFSSQVNAPITSVAYKGENALIPDLLTGTVSLGFLNLPITLPFIRDGRLRALAVTTREPVPELKGVPTLRSLGIDGMEVEGWAALLAAKGISEQGLARLETVLNHALTSQAVRERFAAFGVTPVVTGRTKLREYIQNEADRWGSVVRTRGIKAE